MGVWMKELQQVLGQLVDWQWVLVEMLGRKLELVPELGSKLILVLVLVLVLKPKLD